MCQFLPPLTHWLFFAAPFLAAAAAGPEKVAIIGSGNWGSAIARIVGANAAAHAEFEDTVNMWVFEEEVDGRKLTEIINTEHENVKYLKGFPLPHNIVAVPDLGEVSGVAV